MEPTPQQGSNIITSLIRTFVPIVVSQIIAWLAAQGIDAEGQVDFISQVVGAVAAALYYLAVRLFETHVKPKAGWLLGKPGAPAYAPAGQVPEEPPQPDVAVYGGEAGETPSGTIILIAAVLVIICAVVWLVQNL